MVVTAGLAITTLLALAERSAAQRERELRFEVAAEAAQQQLRARVEQLGDEFEAGVGFIGATHPSPTRHYRDYFQRTANQVQVGDPGMLLLEEVPRSELGSLNRRELLLGNPPLAIKELGVSTTEDALVITRAATTSGNINETLLGYDVAVARPLLVPQRFPSSGYALRVAASSWLIRPFEETRLDLGPYEEIPEFTPFFIGPVTDARGTEVGLALRFLYADQLASGLRLPEHVNVRLSVEAIDEPIVLLPTEPETDMGTSGLFRVHQVRTAGQPWTVEVWADPAFDRTDGLSAAQSTLAFGLLVSAALGVVAAMALTVRNRLVGANFELELARTLATTDHLTGLLNRQGLIDRARALPPDLGATLFFVDLDGFKSVNDEDGHEAGDVVLSAVGRALRTTFRQTDLVARLGGDEFVVFRLSDGLDRGFDVGLVAERLVDRVGQIDQRISCSVGIATRAAGEPADVKDLLRRADQAMYEAKRGGGAGFAVAGAS